jgi:hypothetical protein
LGSTANVHSGDPRKYYTISRAIPIASPSNRRLVALNDKGVTFKWKNYRLEGRERYGVMTLDTHGFIRRFLMHVLPQGFHRIRYYGLLTSPTRANNIARIRELLAVPLLPIDAIKAATTKPEELKAPEHPCPCCGSRMRIIEIFFPGQQPSTGVRTTAKAPPDPTSGEDPDRHFMMTISEPSPRKAVPLSARSSAGHGSPRSDATITTQQPHRSSPLNRPGHPKNASPSTCITSLAAQPPLAAELSCGPPTAKSP